MESRFVYNIEQKITRCLVVKRKHHRIYMMAPRSYHPSHPTLLGVQTSTPDAGRGGVVYGVASGGNGLVKLYPLIIKFERLAPSRDLGDNGRPTHYRAFAVRSGSRTLKEGRQRSFISRVALHQ